MTITQRKTITALQKSVEKNAIKLYDKRTDIINAFANKDNFPKNLKLDDYLFDDLKSKPKFGESIAERIKKGRQK